MTHSSPAPRPSLLRSPGSRTLLACIGLACVTMASAALAQSRAAASSPAGSAPIAAVAAGREEGVRWKALTPPQREALAPLEREWPGIDASRKLKWITLAARFQSFGPEERARITARMSEWARLTPAERGQARLRFEEARQLPAPDRNARWQAYQALPADTKQQLAARAAASSPADAARRDAVAKAGRGKGDGKADGNVKANLVPNPALAQPVRPIGPTLVQAAPGATTTLITRRPTPPSHQQSGMPKIAATPEFVNRSTLLPRRGPQAAAVTPVAGPGAVNAPPGVIVSPPVTTPIVPTLPAAAVAKPAPASSGAQ